MPEGPTQAAAERRRDSASAAPSISGGELARAASEVPVVRFLNGVLERAVRDGASDIHFEPFEREFKVRCRIDGALREFPAPSPGLALPVASRLKVLAGLDIAERRVPQDGRIRLKIDGREVDLRISTLPTQFGESMVLRVLDQAVAPLDLARLGLPADIEQGVREVVGRPGGLFLVTGPTGSGKTTTLYGCLGMLNTPDAKILTAEDPVEYEIDGLVQLPVNPAIGLSFGTALRSFLRQDPDAIMVGEIRDLETAQIAVQAALTGHFVLGTLHTNDAPSAVTRLLDMGIEPYLVCSTLEAVLAQRLVRKICPDCREPFEPAPALLADHGLESGRPFFWGPGCDACRRTGYSGRMGIYEWSPLPAPLRDLVIPPASAAFIKKAAGAKGLRPLREAGLAAVFRGDTTLEEAVRNF